MLVEVMAGWQLTATQAACDQGEVENPDPASGTGQVLQNRGLQRRAVAVEGEAGEVLRES